MGVEIQLHAYIFNMGEVLQRKFFVNAEKWTPDVQPNA